MGLCSDIFPCTYVEISANHIGLGSVILPFLYAEIRDNRAVWAQLFFLVHM
jgi:hypothetical protein